MLERSESFLVLDPSSGRPGVMPESSPGTDRLFGSDAMNARFPTLLPARTRRKVPSACIDLPDQPLPLERTLTDFHAGSAAIARSSAPRANTRTTAALLC